ncbi:MAG: hypothetical protein WD177_01470, partial [Methylophaga sp.]
TPLALADEAALKQQRLDVACEAARDEKLAPERRRFIEQCTAQQEKSSDECRYFYQDYGDALIRQGEVVRPPLYYDLPACQAAFEFQQRYRRPD